MSMVRVEEDDRPSDLPDEGERPSGVASIPATPSLASCGHPGAFRRDLCRSCYRKLWEADLLPPIAPGTKPRHPLQRWLVTLDVALLIQLKAWIEEITQ